MREIKNLNNIKLKKEFNSFKRKLNKDLVWFSALPKEKQWDLLFRWKSYKYFYKSLKRKHLTIRLWLVDIRKKTNYFDVSVQEIRDISIKKILNIK